MYVCVMVYIPPSQMFPLTNKKTFCIKIEWIETFNQEKEKNSSKS